MGRTRRSRVFRVRRGHRSELFLSRSPTPPPSRISGLTLNLRSRFARTGQQRHRRTQRRPERDPDRPNVVGRPDGRPVGVGRRMLKEQRRSFVNRGRRQPRTQRPTSVPLTSGPKVHPTATHHGRSRRPPLEPTHRRRDLPAPRGAAHRKLGDQHRPKPAHRRRGLPLRPSGRRGRVLPPRPSATSSGSGVHLPGSATGSAASRPLLTVVIRVLGRTSPPWVQQSSPSALPQIPQAGPSKPRPLSGSPRLGSSASRTSPRHPRSPPSCRKALLRAPPSVWRALLSEPRALPSVWRPLRGIPRLLSGNVRVSASGPKPLSGLPTPLLASPRPRRGSRRASASARRALRGPSRRRGLRGDPLMVVAGRTPRGALGCAGISTRRHHEHLSGQRPLHMAIRKVKWTLPPGGPPSGPRSFRRVRRRADTRRRRRLRHRGGLRSFRLVTPGAGTWTRRLGRRSDRRPWSLVGTCSGTLRLRRSDPRRHRSGTRWRSRGPRSRFGGRCRDPRYGGRDPATEMTGPMAGRGGDAPGRCLPTRRPLPGRRAGGSGWWRWC